MRAPRLPMDVESFEGFSILRLSQGVQDSHIKGCMQSLKHLAEKGESLVFIDLGLSPPLTSSLLNQLANEIIKVKNDHPLEIILLSEPELAEQMRASALAKSAEFYHRRDPGEIHLATEQNLKSGQSLLFNRLQATLDGAIDVALMRWIKEKPLGKHLEAVSINPSTDRVALVEMNIDGHAFQVFLSSPQATLRQMLKVILSYEVEKSDPAIDDAACELLNYLTAFLKQHISTNDSEVAIEAPQFLPPEAVMEVLNEHDRTVFRVQSSCGPFNVWLELGP